MTDDERHDGPLLEARDVRVEIGGVTIVEAADLTLDAGQLVAVVGPNGAGKSTLVRAAAGIQSFSAGSVRWLGTDVRKLRGRRLARIRAFVPQRPRVPDGLTVRDALRIGRSAHIGPLQRPTRTDRDAVERAMERAGVTRFAERKLVTLSGGELQRVQIGVGLAQEAPVLMADEPTSHLDLGRHRRRGAAAATPRRRGSGGAAGGARPRARRGGGGHGRRDVEGPFGRGGPARRGARPRAARRRSGTSRRRSGAARTARRACRSRGSRDRPRSRRTRHGC